MYLAGVQRLTVDSLCQLWSLNLRTQEWTFDNTCHIACACSDSCTLAAAAPCDTWVWCWCTKSAEGACFLCLESTTPYITIKVHGFAHGIIDWSTLPDSSHVCSSTECSSEVNRGVDFILTMLVHQAFNGLSSDHLEGWILCQPIIQYWHQGPVLNVELLGYSHTTLHSREIFKLRLHIFSVTFHSTLWQKVSISKVWCDVGIFIRWLSSIS